jgi:hypothetical protein
MPYLCAFRETYCLISNGPEKGIIVSSIKSFPRADYSLKF